MFTEKHVTTCPKNHTIFISQYYTNKCRKSGSPYRECKTTFTLEKYSDFSHTHNPNLIINSWPILFYLYLFRFLSPPDLSQLDYFKVNPDLSFQNDFLRICLFICFLHIAFCLSKSFILEAFWFTENLQR